MDAYSLATRNTVEIVRDEDLRGLLNKPKKRVYAGYEPSGEIHLGHMVTINKLMDLREAGFEVVVLLADLHAFLNRKGTMDEVQELAAHNRRCFEAAGLRDVEFVLGSDLQLNPEYEMLVLRLSRQITLNRATRSMDEVGRQMEHPTVSQMIYPVMQIADIAALDVDAAVGGIDQRKIHMLAREYLPAVDRPAPVCVHTPMLNGLDGKKMSSSGENYVSLADSGDVIERKLKKAFCPPETENNPVLQILRYHIMPRVTRAVLRRPEKFGGDREFSTYAGIEEAYASGGIHALDLKMMTARYLTEIFADVRDRMG